MSGQNYNNQYGQYQGYNSQQQGYDPNAYGAYQQQGYDPNAYGASQQQGYDPNAYGAYQQQGYDPNAYGSYQQQGYDPNAYGAYQQQGYDPNAYGSYQQQGYDPNAYGAYQQQGYDPNAYGAYQQQGYDPNAYGAYNYNNLPQQQQQPPNNDPNPIRINVTPNNPATSSNNITLNLESLYERLRQENISKVENETYEYNIGLKNFLTFSYNNNLVNKLFSSLCDSESFIANGPISSVNNSTVSINNKIIALKYIHYIEVDINSTNDMMISSFFSSTPQPSSSESSRVNEMFTFLYSKRSFNQYISICIESTFLTTLSQLIILDLNQDIIILRSDTSYIVIPINKIVSIE